jgi:DNA processing protein
MVPNVGDVHARALVNHFGSAQSIFKARRKDLESLDGMGIVRAASITNFKDFSLAEKEIEFIEKFKIKPLFVTDTSFPQRMLNSYDCPVLLYYKGEADLNAPKAVAVVGTRNNTDYGKNLCEKFIEDLISQEVLIISGLAFGIDTIAHKAALKNNLPTVAVLGHGLDIIYPPENNQIARQIINNGGLLTEFTSRTKPDRQNFPLRNRIVAGISDAVVVIETGIKGGSLITAELGAGYNKDVFAFPGKVNDNKSEGCNFLIKTNKAGLITSAEDLVQNMGWAPIRKKRKQKQLFIELKPDEKVIVDILQKQEQVHIDELYMQSKLSSSKVAAALLMLEMESVIESLPGKLYRLH